MKADEFADWCEDHFALFLVLYFLFFTVFIVGFFTLAALMA